MASDSMRDVYKALLILAAMVAATVALVRFVCPYFTPFIVAVVIAFLIDPVVNFFEMKVRIPRGAAVLLVLSVFALVLLLFLVIGVYQLQVELGALKENFEYHQDNLYSSIEYWVNETGRFFESLPTPLIGVLEGNKVQLESQVRRLISSSLNLLAGVPGFLSVFLISIIATYFVSKDKTRVTTVIFEFLPEKQRRSARRIEYQILGSVVKFIRAQLILMVITMIITIVWLSAMRVNYAWLLGLLAGLLDVLPMVGPAALLVPWAVYSALTGSSFLAVGLGLLVGAQVLIRQILEPKIVGKSIGLHPLGTLIAIYLGYRLFGVSGFVVGPLAAILFKAVYAEVVLPLISHR